MTKKEILKEKIKKANNTKQETPKIPGAYGMKTMTLSELQWWMGEGFRKQKFDTEIINMAGIFREKIQFLLHGKPYIIELDQDEDGDIDQEDRESKQHEEVKKFITSLKLQETMFANEGNMFDNGRGYIIIDKKPNGQPSLRLGEPGFPNTVTRVFGVKVAADVYTPFMFDKVKYYMRTTYTQDKIINRIFTVNSSLTTPHISNLKKVNLKTLNSKLPKQFQIKGTMPNPYGFIPVVEVTYKPTIDYSWDAKNKLAPIHKIKGLQTLLNEGTKALRLELYLNRTKIMVDEDMLNANDKAELEAIAEAGILGVLKDTGGVDGDKKLFEVLKGDPKVDQYWENIANIITLAASSLKLSELGETDSSTSATGEIFNKGNDVETANTLQIFRQEAISEILTKAWAIEKNETFTEDELDTSKWSVQLIPNVIMNEAKMTEIVIKQLSAGLINMTQALVKLEGISPSDAKNKLAQEDGVENPMLEASTSFNDYDEDDEEQTTGSGKEVVGGK